MSKNIKWKRTPTRKGFYWFYHLDVNKPNALLLCLERASSDTRSGFVVVHFGEDEARSMWEYDGYWYGPLMSPLPPEQNEPNPPPEKARAWKPYVPAPEPTLLARLREAMEFDKDE